jgi:hypothetical protein
VSFTQRPCQFCNGVCLDTVAICDEEIKVLPGGTCPLPMTSAAPIGDTNTTSLTDVVSADAMLDEDDLGPWPWVGLGIGLCVLLLIILVVVLVVMRRRKRAEGGEDPTPPPPDATQSFFDDVATEAAYVPRPGSTVFPTATSEYASAAGLANLPPPSASSATPVIYSSMSNVQPKETGPIVYEAFS